MLKKVAIVALVVVAGLFLLNRTDLGSYMGTAWKKVRSGAADQVPLEFEIERLKNEVSQLVPDMKKNLKVLADEMVAVENLKRDVEESRVALDKQRTKVLALKTDLEKNRDNAVVSFGGRQYSTARLQEKLAREWKAFQLGEQGLKAKEELLVAKEEAIDVARQQLSAMRQKKEQMEVEVARLETLVKTERLRETQSNFQLDDSRVARIQAGIQAVRDRLQSRAIEASLHAKFVDELELPAEQRVKTDELLKEINSSLGHIEAEEVAAGNK
jgi:chromosome segregation ATPase